MKKLFTVLTLAFMSITAMSTTQNVYGYVFGSGLDPNVQYEEPEIVEDYVEEYSEEVVDEYLEEIIEEETTNDFYFYDFFYPFENYDPQYSYRDNEFISKGLIPTADIYTQFSGREEAETYMEQTTVNVWVVGSNGEKVATTKKLSVHRDVIDEAWNIFELIFQGEEQFPIKDLGGYSWRGDNSTSSHNLGLAIDLNYDENFMIRGDEIVAGSFWDPETSIYSIKPDGDVVRAFEEYGWFWAGNGWGSTYDYMHFSRTGV